MKQYLAGKKFRWLVTGAAGFIGSNLVESLLAADQEVIGLDNFSTGRKENLSEIESKISSEKWKNFTFIEGTIEDISIVEKACAKVDFILHHAALASVPYSIKDPKTFHDVNVTGFLNILQAARSSQVKRVVFASSSAVYGDENSQPAKEERVGRLLSPYALSKKVNEEYAQTFEQCFGLNAVGLRYFNVFGPRQDPHGAYAAVIPIWMNAILRGEQIQIFGDGETTRDFCYIDDVVQANILAALSDLSSHSQRIFNVAASQKTSLNELYNLLCEALAGATSQAAPLQPKYRDFRPGDVRHSMADIGKAEKFLKYKPKYRLQDGIESYLTWCQKQIH